MKRKIILFVAVAFFALSINSTVKGDHQNALKFGAATAVSLIAMSSPVSNAFGVFGSPGLSALERNTGRFSTRTRDDFAAKNVVAYDDTLYIRRDITAKGGVFRTIEANTVKTLGLCNIDKNRLPEGENFAIEKIWIAQASNATEIDPTKVVNYTNVMSSVEAELRHAELVISQDSKQILRLPISSILAAGAITTASKKDAAYSLEDNCPVIIENTPFEVNIEFPAIMATKSASANKFLLEIELFGKKTGRKFA
jgi:hypothetical protein